MEEKYEHRANDHLVEPFLGGLGVGEGQGPESEEQAEARLPAQKSWIRRILEYLGWKPA